jgi:uncharacterized protein
MQSQFDPSYPNSIESLQIVYKVVERCNLNCSYCYYFNMGDNSAMERPAKASIESADALAEWLAAGCLELQIPIVRIAFHGGEPMLSQVRHFDRICRNFRDKLDGVARLEFSIQTNGTIFSDAWLNAFIEHRVSVGVSIDGRQPDHDRYRLDHRGRSSFCKTEETLRRLVAESVKHPVLRPSTISVLDPDVDYTETYRYLRSLGVRYLHFLLPDRNADSASPEIDEIARRIGHGLHDLFVAWLTEDEPTVEVRIFSELLGLFEVGASLSPKPRHKKANQILVARSDGTVTIDDTYLPALDWYAAAPEFKIADTSLKGVLADKIFRLLDAETSRLPDACGQCTWRQLCRGGDLENRFSRARGFNNRSVYCETYKTLYAGMCNTLLENGYPTAELERRFEDLCHA